MKVNDDQILTEERRTNQEFVESFFRELEVTYGLENKNIRDLFEDLEWIRQYRNNISKYGEHGIRTIMGVIVLGFAIAIWEGIKLFIHR